MNDFAWVQLIVCYKHAMGRVICMSLHEELFLTEIVCCRSNVELSFVADQCNSGQSSLQQGGGGTSLQRKEQSCRPFARHIPVSPASQPRDLPCGEDGQRAHVSLAAAQALLPPARPERSHAVQNGGPCQGVLRNGAAGREESISVVVVNPSWTKFFFFIVFQGIT